MLSGIFFVKLVVSVLVVLILSIVAERISTRTVGILSGFPTGTAIVLFFFGLELGPKFASESAIFNLVGLLAMNSFLYAYYKSSDIFKKSSIVLSSIAAILAYFVVAYLLHLIEFTIMSAVVVPVFAIVFFNYLFRGIKDIKIRKGIRLGPKVLYVRALVAASIILVVTEVAKFVGPIWAGLFSAFPTTVFPLLLIVHLTYGMKYIPTIVKNIPLGQGSLLLYSLAVYFVYPIYGIYLGTLFAYLVASFYLLILRNRIK